MSHSRSMGNQLYKVKFVQLFKVLKIKNINTWLENTGSTLQGRRGQFVSAKSAHSEERTWWRDNLWCFCKKLQTSLNHRLSENFWDKTSNSNYTKTQYYRPVKKLYWTLTVKTCYFRTQTNMTRSKMVYSISTEVQNCLISKCIRF